MNLAETDLQIAQAIATLKQGAMSVAGGADAVEEIARTLRNEATPLSDGARSSRDDAIAAAWRSGRRIGDSSH